MKLGYAGVYLIFALKSRIVGTRSNLYPQSMFYATIRKISKFFV